MATAIENYKVHERLNNDLVGTTAEDLKKKYAEDLKEMESLWSKYSSDCLGHGLECTRLKLMVLNERLNL